MDADPIRQTDDDDIFDFAMALVQNRTIEECYDLLDRITSESINARDSQGYTRLEWATAFSRRDFRSYLITKGATPTGNQFHRNVLFIALQYVNQNWNETLDGFSPETIDFSGANAMNDTALHLALYGAKWGFVTAILDQPENDEVNTVNSSEETPLHLAAKSKCGIRTFDEIVRRTTRDKINAFDAYGYTALHWAAASERSAKKIQSLLDKGADVNAQDKGDGNTALHLVLMKKSITGAEQLLKCDNLDVNVKATRRWTALHQAAAWSNVPADLFKKILQKSCDVNAKTILGRTALHLALRKRSATATDELLSCGYNQKGPVVNVDVGDGHGKTALHYAAQWPDIPPPLFNAILDNTIDLNAKEKTRGLTALHLAIDAQSETAITQLLKHEKVDVNVEDNQKRTATHLMDSWPDMPPDLHLLMNIRLQKLNDTPDHEHSIGQDVSVDTDGKLRKQDANKEEEDDDVARQEPNERNELAKSVNQTESPSKTIAVEENEFRQLCALDQLNERKSEAGPERSLSQLVSFSTLGLIPLFLIPLAAIIFATMK
ncbi:serine/threonine-protein phosphatase 6 regulatory ankyrin repeat subunit B-like [Daphnia magna]|uniref:serine/threonine-protein phosphatase 6 regulatory ankyrin repeat subunit B-like n=1 Tax=Daphnia magna TaxID=35525 RepID=UPI001E1BD4E1|nr:serine/threonine-protein phosphatase 6 regulatory ankyrin repeat subunit B-like [Daphnia magna]